MVQLPQARLPDGLRVYAIGDVHGCTATLQEMHGRIARDLAARPVADWRIVHVGDYVDRGPDNAGAVGFLARAASDPRVVCLRGNHDQYLIDFLADPDAGSFDAWLFNGGETTLRDYGAEAGELVLVGPRRQRDLHAALLGAMPPAHRVFLDGLGLMHREGDYLFVHAGIRPGVALADQAARDLLWIRDEFLASAADHGVVVVHGHTPSAEVTVRRNRIGIDTGAVYGGRLSCLVLEGVSQTLLGAGGPLSLAPPGEA